MSQQPTESGLVVAAFGRRGILEAANGEELKYLVKGRHLRVVCGDHVEWEPDRHDGKAIVRAVKPRGNTLERQPPDRHDSEVLAANIGCIVVVCAPEPATDWFLMDRYLATASLMQCRAMLVDNKLDLATPATNGERQKELANYRQLGYTCLHVSAQNGDGIEILLTELSDTIAILVGQSGVGKSSLINRLVPNADILVAELSAASAEGTHTTTASAMHRLPGGGRLIDTPGVRDFIPAIDEARSVQFGFPEISALAGQCRFNDCRHLREPDCAVKQAVESGQVSARRFETYRRLVRDL